jgi:hypothetical protein
MYAVEMYSLCYTLYSLFVAYIHLRVHRSMATTSIRIGELAISISCLDYILEHSVCVVM